MGPYPVSVTGGVPVRWKPARSSVVRWPVTRVAGVVSWMRAFTSLVAARFAATTVGSAVSSRSVNRSAMIWSNERRTRMRPSLSRIVPSASTVNLPNFADRVESSPPPDQLGSP